MYIWMDSVDRLMALGRLDRVGPGGRDTHATSEL